MKAPHTLVHELIVALCSPFGKSPSLADFNMIKVGLLLEDFYEKAYVAGALSNAGAAIGKTVPMVNQIYLRRRNRQAEKRGGAQMTHEELELEVKALRELVVSACVAATVHEMHDDAQRGAIRALISKAAHAASTAIRVQAARLQLAEMESARKVLMEDFPQLVQELSR